MKKLLPIFALLLGFWVLIRWISISIASDAFTEDPDNYRRLACELSVNGVYGATANPTAFRPPLYPWILSFGVNASHELSLVFTKILHTFLGASTCFLTFFLTAIAQHYLLPSRFDSIFDHTKINQAHPYKHYFQHACAPFLAASLVCIDPILVRQSQLIMTETLATFLSATTLVLMFRAYLEPSVSKLLTVGVAIGLSVLCRPTAIVWGGLFIAALAFGQLSTLSPIKLTNRRIAQCVLAFSIGLCVCIFPWGLRNRTELNRWIFTTTHGGYTLLLANNNSLYDHFEKTASRNWDDTDFQSEWSTKIVGLNELEQDKLASSSALQTIQQRPRLFAKSCLIRLAWLWAPWPNQSNRFVRTGIGVWYSLAYAAAFCGVIISVRRRGGFLTSPVPTNAVPTNAVPTNAVPTNAVPTNAVLTNAVPTNAVLTNAVLTNPVLMPTACLILSLSLVHAVYWSNLRMRSVAMPAIYTLACIPISLAISSSTKPRKKQE